MLLFIMFFVLYFLSKKGNYTSTFISLAFLYFYLFYIYPLVLISNSNNFYYIGYNYNVNINDVVFSTISGLLFVFGFYILDILLVLKNRKRSVMSDLWSLQTLPDKAIKLSYLFYIILVLISCFYLYSFFDAGRALRSYDIRSGENQGSRLAFLSSIIIYALYSAILFCLIYARRRKLAIAFLILVLLVLLTGATGRATLMINLLIFFMLFFRLKVRLVLLSSIFLAIMLLPIILNLKSIIYSVSVNSELPSLLDIYFSEPNLDTVLSNLGHPIVSLLRVDGIIDNLGFRYFYDYFQGIAFYLKPFGIDFGDSLIYYNTENLIGQRASIIPTGYLAFGYVQLGLAGIIVSGMFYRFVGYVGEYVYKSLDIKHDVVKFYLAYMAASSFYHGEVRVMIITFFIPMFIIYFFRPSRFTSNDK